MSSLEEILEYSLINPDGVIVFIKLQPRVAAGVSLLIISTYKEENSVVASEKSGLFLLILTLSVV